MQSIIFVFHVDWKMGPDVPDMSLAMNMNLHIKFLLRSFNFTQNLTGSTTCHKVSQCPLSWQCAQQLSSDMHTHNNTAILISTLLKFKHASNLW